MANIVKDIYVDLQKAARSMEEAEKRAATDPSQKELLGSIQRTRKELEDYTKHLDKQMGYSPGGSGRKMLKRS